MSLIVLFFEFSVFYTLLIQLDDRKGINSSKLRVFEDLA